MHVAELLIDVALRDQWLEEDNPSAATLTLAASNDFRMVSSRRANGTLFQA